MRLEVPALGVTLALALSGCAGPIATGGSGWRIFDSAFDGYENAKVVDATADGDFDHVFEGSSAFGHKAYFESALRANETLRLVFRAEESPQVRLALRDGPPFAEYRCEDGGAGANITVDDERASGHILGSAAECVFELTLRRDIVASNGVQLVWEATTIAGDERDKGPGGGLPLHFEATRSFPSIQNS
jgi:hypothetical protein